jgi:hypothetical protein
MNEINQALGTDATDEIDDVEGHGLKEIAVGLGAAGIVATGAASAMAMSGPTGPSVDRLAPIVVHTVDQAAHEAKAWETDPMGRSDATTDAALATARGARATAVNTTLNTAANAVTGATTAATGALDSATSAVDGVRGLAGTTATSATRTAQTTVANVDETATDAIGSTRTLANIAEAGAKNVANNTVLATQRTAGDAVKTARTATSGVHTSVEADSDGVTVAASAAGVKVEVQKH